MTAAGQTSWVEFAKTILEEAAKTPQGVAWFVAATDGQPLGTVASSLSRPRVSHHSSTPCSMAMTDSVEITKDPGMKEVCNLLGASA